MICQSFTFSATANPIKYLGATPVFVDSEPDTWKISPALLEVAIKDRISKTGRPPKQFCLSIFMVCQQGWIKLWKSQAVMDSILEDAAEALGSRYLRQCCGTLVTLLVFPLNGNKMITTSGEVRLSVRPLRRRSSQILRYSGRDNAPHYQHSELATTIV